VDSFGLDLPKVITIKVNGDTMATTPAVKSFSEMTKAQNLPVRIKTERLSELGVVTFESAFADTATLPGTNEETDGFLVSVTASDGRRYTSFVGGQALVAVLAEASFPFKARIVKDGRTWVFSD
jgi:hypothetical protein